MLYSIKACKYAVVAILSEQLTYIALFELLMFPLVPSSYQLMDYKVKNKSLAYSKKQYQKAAHTFSLVFLGQQFVKIGQAGEAGVAFGRKHSSNFFQTLPNLNPKTNFHDSFVNTVH